MINSCIAIIMPCKLHLPYFEEKIAFKFNRTGFNKSQANNSFGYPVIKLKPFVFIWFCSKGFGFQINPVNKSLLLSVITDRVNYFYMLHKLVIVKDVLIFILILPLLVIYVGFNAFWSVFLSETRLSSLKVPRKFRK